MMAAVVGAVAFLERLQATSMATITGDMMKKTISVVALAALSMALTAAGVGASQEKQIPELQRSSAVAPEGTTITGCVARGTGAETYTLTEAKKNTSATATPGAPAAPLTLAAKDVDLSKHVGHSVELTGSWATAADAPIGTAGTERPATADASKMAAKTFTVKSVKMVASSCQTGGN